MSGLTALHEWLLIWAEDDRVHDSLKYIVVGAYWGVLVLILLRLISVEPLSRVEVVTGILCEEQPTQRTSERRSSTPPLHTYDDEPDPLYDRRIFEQRYNPESIERYPYQGSHFFAIGTQEGAWLTPLEYTGLEDRFKRPNGYSKMRMSDMQKRIARIDTSPKRWLEDEPSDKIWTPATSPTADTIVMAPYTKSAGGASPTPDARNRALKTNFSSMRHRTDPSQNQGERNQMMKEKEKTKQREKHIQRKKEQERAEHEKIEHEKKDQEKKYQERKDEEERTRNRIRRGKGKKKKAGSTKPLLGDLMVFKYASVWQVKTKIS